MPAGQGWDRPTTVTDEEAPEPPYSRSDLLVFFGLLMALSLVLSAVTLDAIPAVQPDEAWYANLAWNWLENGQRWTTIDVGPFPDGMGQGTTTLGALPSRVAIQLWGLTLRSVRTMSYMAGLAALVAVAVLGAQLWSYRVGLLAALMLSLQPLFLAGSHLNRPEIWLLLFSALALSASLRGWRRKQPLWDALAAVLAVLSVEIHQHGAVFAIALAATYIARHGRYVCRQRGAWAFASVAGIGGVTYVYRHVGQFISAEAAERAFGAGTSHAIPLLSDHPVVWIIREMVRYSYFVSSDQLGALLLALGILLAVRRMTSADRVLLAWLAVAALTMALFVNRVFDVYLLPMVGMAILLAGCAAAELLGHAAKIARQAVLVTIAVLLVPVLGFAADGLRGDPMALQHELSATVPCQRILAPNQFWFAFTDCDYRSFDLISHYHHLQGLSLGEAMAEIRPDYVIVDETVEPKLGEDFEIAADVFSYYKLPRDEYERFLDERTSLVRLFTLPGRGAIQVRRVSWEP